MDRVKLPLSSIFDADPLAVLALRIRHADGCVWRVAGDTLTLVTSGLTWDADLSVVTLGGLVNLLVADGFEVAYQNDDILHLSALVLLEGTGNQADSNGDHLTAYTAPLAVVQAAMGRSLAIGRDSVPQALAQMILPDATAEWADLFGEVFGVPRVAGLSDSEYTTHIIAEVTRARSNPVAMRLNLLRLTGRDYELREPWKEVAYLGLSRLSGDHHLQGAPIYQYHTLQVRSLGGTEWPAILEEVTADKPAGTVSLPPAVLIDEIRVLGPYESYLIVPWRTAVWHFFVYWNTTAWTEVSAWDDRQWASDVRPILMTGWS